MTWNPFAKAPGEQLTQDDLGELIGRVAEGYYVEYKADFPNPKKIAHSIASLANTYGGWYIIGVKTDEFDVANEICGFSLDLHRDPISKIRDVVKMRIDPVPMFYPMSVPLRDREAVLVVYVPGNQRTPFITDDGRVYRRNHASSDPVFETSRHTLDRLVDDGKRLGSRFMEFCKRTEKVPPKMYMPGGIPVGWFNLFLALEPAPVADSNRGKTVSELLEITQRQHQIHISDEVKGTGNLPFKSGHTTPHSIVLRQSEPWSVVHDQISAEFSLDGYARLSVPLPHPSIDEMGNLRLASKAAAQALDRIRDADQNLRLFNGADLPAQILVFTAIYNALRGPAEWSPNLRVAFSFLGLGGAAPYVDVDQWAEQVESNGIPVLEDTIRFPDDWNDTRTLPFEDITGMMIVIMVARSLGLEPEVALAGLLSSAAGKLDEPPAR